MAKPISIAETERSTVTLSNGEVFVFKTDLLATLSITLADTGVHVQGRVSCAAPEGAGFREAPVDVVVTRDRAAASTSTDGGR